MTIELAVTPDSRWEAGTADLVAAVGAEGFAALGMGADRIDATTIDAYRTAGIRCHEVLALVLSDDSAATIATAERLAQAATAISSPWVLTTFRAPLTVDTAPTIQTCARLFAEAGAGMAVEFSPLGPVGTITAGMDVVRAANAGRGRAGLMIDTWHFCFGESTWADLAAVPLEEIAYVQFTDALPVETDKLFKETMDRRALPGEGFLELSRFATILLDRGYDGIVSAEVLSRALLATPANELARAIHDAMAPYWR